MKHRETPTKTFWQGWHGLHASDLDEDARAALASAKPRAKPRKLEQAEQEALTAKARTRWWWPGYRHHMAERQSQSEAFRGSKLGVRPGWPDVTLHIPATTRDMVTMGGWFSTPILAALELKFGSNQPTQAQLDTLTLLESCGYQCKVAWGHEEALAWLDMAAGPRPEVMPEGW